LAAIFYVVVKPKYGNEVAQMGLVKCCFFITLLLVFYIVVVVGFAVVVAVVSCVGFTPWRNSIAQCYICTPTTFD